MVHHRDIEVVDHIPDDPQDIDKDESSDNDDQDELIDASNLQENSDKEVDFADDSVDSEGQDVFMLKTTIDTNCLNDNIKNSGRCSGKNHTKKTIYEDYPVLPTEVIPINLLFSTKDIISSFKLNHGVEVTEDDAPLDLIMIPGKKLYFLQANSKLIKKLKKLNKKYKKSEDYTVIPLCGNKEEYVVYPIEKNAREYNVPERFYILTKFNQYNWIVPKGKFFYFYTICLNFYF